jgi:hypothetical protein
MNKPSIIRAITLAVGAGAALALTVPASASPRMTAASASGGDGVTIHYGALKLAHIDPGIGLGTATATSTRTFAGYETAVTAGSATVATASFTVPTLSCTASESDNAIALSAGVPVDKGKSASIAYVFTGCVNGQATYYPGLLVNGTETDYPTAPVAAGDVIDLTTKVSVNRTRVQVTDVTTNVTEKLMGSGASASDAYFGDSGWGSSTGALVHVPDFGKLTYKDCLIDGKALASWRPHSYQRVNSIGRVQITTGGIWPTGTAFTTHFQHT